jgi:hypothetical protein
VVIGVIADLGAVIFYLALKYTGRFLLGYLAGYHVPTPLVDGGKRGSPNFPRPWAIPLVTTAGGLLRRCSSLNLPRRPPATAPTARSRPSTPIRATSGSESCW